MYRTPLQTLRDYGQSPWIGGVPREFAVDGSLARFVAGHGISGFSFDSDGGIADIRHACDLLLEQWWQSAGRDGHVSFRLRGALGTEPEQIRSEALLLAGVVERPNLLVGIPSSPAGVSALEDLVAAGVSVDATAIFSLEQHTAVMDAYTRGLARLVRGGGDPAVVTSVATIPVGRIDTEVSRCLLPPDRATPEFGGTLGIAVARLAHRQYRSAFASREWQRLQGDGGRPQRCRWTSTDAAGPAYYDVMYVEALIGAETLTTLTPATADAFEDHGICADRLERPIEAARQHLEQARARGVDLDEIWRTLNRGGAADAGDFLASIS